MTLARSSWRDVSWIRSFTSAIVVVISCTLLIQVHGNTSEDESLFNGDIRHGGIKMGISSDVCDNAKDALYVDWEPGVSGADLEYTCQGEKNLPQTQIGPRMHCDKQEHRPLHKCMTTPIHYKDRIPLSGEHRPLWPMYGDYLYCPPQRWLHSMEHGAAVFLYHPCVEESTLALFKNIATSCLRRHIITPNRKLTESMPFAILTWMCKIEMSYVDINAAVSFLKKHALDAPEKRTARNGQYSLGLVKSAVTVHGSDYWDVNVCPDDNIKMLLSQDPLQKRGGRDADYTEFEYL